MKKLNELTIEEKMRLICGDGSWHTADLEGKLPRLKVSDGPVGLRTHDDEDTTVTIPAVAYPSIQMLANSWSKGCVREMAHCLADDCAERKVDVLLAPGVNIKRSPFCGRNFEYFSEDPYLAGTLAYEYIAGVQEYGVGTCLKHFVANNLEYDRFHQSSDIDERTMREIYYKPFELACKANPVSVMCSYNRVNGVYASENEKGFAILRNEFGFDGAIVSDWGAVRDRTAAAKAGLDLEMPFSATGLEKLQRDYAEGKITEAEIDACAQRMLTFIEQYGERKAAVRSTEAERREAAKNIAAEGMVLLKNNGVLPLKRGTKAAVSGCYARPDSLRLLGGGGSAFVKRKEDDAFDLPAALLGRLGGDVTYEIGFRYDNIDTARRDARAAIEEASLADVAIVCAGTGASCEYEGADRKSIRLSEIQERQILETAAINRNTVVVLFAGAAIDTSAWDGEVAAIVYAGFPGTGGDEIVADLLAGKRNFCGKLSETFPYTSELPEDFRSVGVTRYAEGLDVGYRYYDSRKKPVVYPFGFGLSYSEFRYNGLKLKKTGALSLDVGYEIGNVSERDGQEISQIYVRPCAPLVYRPYQELKGYSKDHIRAKQTRTVTVTLDKSAFAYWSVAKDGWTVDDGVYEIVVGASSRDIRLSGKIRIKDGEIVLR